MKTEFNPGDVVTFISTGEEFLVRQKMNDGTYEVRDPLGRVWYFGENSLSFKRAAKKK